MATEQERKAFRSALSQLLKNDQYLFSTQGKVQLADFLKQGKELGFVDDDLIKGVELFKASRLKTIQNTPLVDPQTGQPALKKNARGQVVPQTGKDLFVGGQFVPQANAQQAAAARGANMAQLQGQTAAEVARLKGVTDVLAPPMSDVGGNLRQFGAAVQGVMGGIGEGAKATNLLGIGNLSKMLGRGPMSAQELQAGLQQTSINDLTAENALEDLSKPARFGGFRFGQGVGGTLGGMVGSEIGAAAMTASGIGKTAAAPFILPLAAAASSFGGAAVANYLSEQAMKGVYGEQGYKDVVRALQAAEQESPGIGMAADFGNVLLQGSPVLASGTGARQTLGMIRKSVLGNAPSYIRGTASQLGQSAPKLAAALESGVALPQAAAATSKYDTFVSNFLRKTGATSAEAIDRYATFTPSGGLGSRIKQFGQFARDTPGVNEFLADAIGEQAVNVGQAAADYYREVREANETGAPPPSAAKALANLAFGSLFIGNNRVTDTFGAKVRGIGSLGLDVAGRVPGINRGVEALRSRYQANLDEQGFQMRRADVLRGITSETPTDTEMSTGFRSRISPASTTRSAITTPSPVGPDERPISLGAGRVALWNSTSQTARIVPFADVYGGIDDAANVDEGKALASGISTLTTVNPARGINRLFPAGNEVLPTEGPAKQQVVGATDTGHIVVREVPVSADNRRQQPQYDIIRLEDLEEGNKSRGVSVLEKAGIEPATELYEPTTVGPAGGSAFDQIAGFQEAIRNIGTRVSRSVNEQFPTIVQFGQNQQLQGRVVGTEKNGDVQVQLMTPGMTIVRVDPSNVLRGSTSVSEPMAISDILDESSMSDEARPRPSKSYDVFKGDQTQFHTISGNNVHLTAAQQAKIPAAVTAISTAQRDAETRSTDRRVINQAVTNEVNKQLKDIFGGRVKPSDARNDYEIGTPITVNGPNGREVGLVIDNADAGPVVHLDSMDGDPVVIQESDVINGQAIPRPEPETAPTTTETTRPTLPTRTERDLFTENVFQDADDIADKKAKAMFIARQLLKRRDDEAGGYPAPSALERVFGFARNAEGKVNATDAQVQSRSNKLHNAMVFQYNRDGRQAPTESELQELLDAINYLEQLTTEALADPNRVRTRARRPATGAAAASAARTAAPRETVARRTSTTPAAAAAPAPAAAAPAAAAPAATTLAITPRQAALNAAGNDGAEQIKVDLKFNNLRKLAAVVKKWFDSPVTINGETGYIKGQNGKGDLLFLANVNGNNVMRTITVASLSVEERTALGGTLENWEAFLENRFIYTTQGTNIEYEIQSPDFPKALRLGVVKVGNNKAETWVGARKIYQGNGIRVFQLSSGQLMYLPTGVDRTPVVDPINTGPTRTGPEVRPRGTTPDESMTFAAAPAAAVTEAPAAATAEAPTAAETPAPSPVSREFTYREEKAIRNIQAEIARGENISWGRIGTFTNGWNTFSDKARTVMANLVKNAGAELLAPEFGDTADLRDADRGGSMRFDFLPMNHTGKVLHTVQTGVKFGPNENDFFRPYVVVATQEQLDNPPPRKPVTDTSTFSPEQLETYNVVRELLQPVAGREVDFPNALSIASRGVNGTSKGIWSDQSENYRQAIVNLFDDAGAFVKDVQQAGHRKEYIKLRTDVIDKVPGATSRELDFVALVNEPRLEYPRVNTDGSIQDVEQNVKITAGQFAADYVPQTFPTGPETTAAPLDVTPENPVVAAAELGVTPPSPLADENIVDSPAANPDIAMTSLQARTLAGLVPSVNGRNVFATRQRDGRPQQYNQAQEVVRKLVKGLTLTRQETALATDLDFPDYAGNEAWYRNAYQGIQYLNDSQVRGIVSGLISWMDQSPSHTPQKALEALTEAQRAKLKSAMFIGEDGKFDSRSLVIYGRTERGIVFGALAQSASNTATANVGDLPNQMISGTSGTIQKFLGIANIDFGSFRATSKSSFTEALTGIMKKTRQGKTESAETLEIQAKAVADMFDTFVHGATARRIDLMMEGVSKGYFSQRSQPTQVRTLSGTRSGTVEFTKSVEEDLRPLYDRLRNILGLARNANLATYLTKPQHAVAVANAYAQLAEEESKRFYSERLPAFANFDVLPDVVDANGALLNIYDPDQQTAISVIMAFSSADISTFVHEVAHAYLEALPLPLQQDISSGFRRSLRAPTLSHPSVLSYELQEEFAYGLEMTLANRADEYWRGTNLGEDRGATRPLKKVLKAVSDAVKATYVALTNSAVVHAKDGVLYRNWEVPYTRSPQDNPTGRVKLWLNAPVILHDGSYAIVKEHFGTTKNGQRLVQIEQNGIPINIPNAEIKAIGGPTRGLTPTVMQIMSQWIGYSTEATKGKVTSTPEARATSIVWDGDKVVHINRSGPVTSGDITSSNVNNILTALGITDISDLQHRIIFERVGREKLRDMNNRLPDINRKFSNGTAPLTQEDNDLRALASAYAEARLAARLRDVSNRGNITQQERAKKALNGAQDSTRSEGGRRYWAAVSAIERQIHANRSVLGTVARDIGAITSKSRTNWAIKRDGNKFAYNATTGEVTIIKKERRGGRTREVEFKVNLKTGVVQRPDSATPVIVPDTFYYHDPQFRTRMPGGLISDINAQVDTALKAVGLDGAYTMRVAEPEFHIARALLSVMMPEGIPTSPSVVFQSSGVSTTDNEEATPMAQLSRNQQKAFVVPTIAVAPVPTGNALVTMQEAEAIGRADQAMQQTSGVKVTAQSPEVRQRQAKFVQNIIDRLTADIDKKLDAARDSYEKKNAGQTPVLYAYEAYELRDVYDVERGEPMVEMEVTESGESIPKLRWDAKAMDYVPVVKTARVRTTIYSYEDLSKLNLPVKQSANLYDTDRHSSSTESATRDFQRLEFGSDRPIWINIKGKEVPSKNKAKVVSAMVNNIEGRVRDVTSRWTSEYNDALEGEAINPTEAWKPQEFDAEVKLRESDGITVLAPSVKVRAQGYAIDTIDGNKGWNSLSTHESKERLTIAQARKELMAYRKVDGTENKHHAVAYPIETDAKGKPVKWGYSLMVRTTDVDPKTGTFQWKIENDWGAMNLGYASSKDALKEAQIEHDKLFGLAREKQEEEVSRHIAREVIEIIDAGRKALDKWNADNNYKFTAEEANAVNILRQFRWYKGMEERLKGTYGQFTTVMADVLGATSPQTPVWQNYAATLFLMQGDKGPHSRRVKLSAQTIARNEALLNYFPDESKQKKAMVVIKTDMRRTISILKMHSIFVKALDKSFGTNPQLTIDGLRDQIASRLSAVYERNGVDDTSGAEADLFVSLFEKDVPEAKRQEVLEQFNRYADKSLPSRMGGTVKKDTQFRSFVNEVEDWISPKGEIARYGGKTAETTKVADLPKGIKLSLSETVVPRNLVTGSLYGSNSQNILMALTNEWLTVTEGMSAKARNFAMNFVGLSRGATIDVWAARLTRRHLNEVYMGVYTTRDGDSVIEDPARYEAWSKLPEAERKQFFRMSPVQEQGVAGGYVTNLPKKVASNGYFTESDKDTEPVKFAPATREAVDVTNAEFIGEFGMANRVFAKTTDLINGYIGQDNFMSPADLQAVVWFAEKERWVQNGWTTAAGAGGSFEQMYHEMMERAGAYERVSGTVYQPRMRMRGASAASLTTDEQKSLFDIAMWPFLRNRRDSYQEGMGDLQREEIVDGVARHPVQSVQALAVTVSNDGMYVESAENANKTNLSVTYLTGAGREAEERSYIEPVPTVIVPESDADIMFKGMTNATRTIYLPVENSGRVLSALHNYSVGARTAFGIQGNTGPRLLGTGVVDSVSVLDAIDVPDDAPAKVKHPSDKYIRIQLAETQPMVDSDVYLWNNSGRSEKVDARTNEYQWGQPLQAFDAAPSLNATAGKDISENRIHVGQIPLEAIKNPNGKKDKKNILPKPAGIPAARPANRAMVIESTASLLAAMRDSTDVFMTTTRAIASADDPYASYLDSPATAVGKVPTGDAWKNTPPESNMRFGAYMLLRMPVGAERAIPGARQAADNAHRRLMTSLRDSMPDVGYMVRIDADVRDWVSDITGNVGMPYVEIVFSPEEFIRNYNPITEVDGELPSNAAERSALFNAYINGDVDAIRAAEERFADAYESWMNRVQNDPDLSAQVMLPGQTVYDLQVIPKERLSNAPSIREFATAEAERQANTTRIADAVRQYAEAIGKTVDVETTDEFYVSADEPRVAQPDSVIEDWDDFREYTVMAQSGRPRVAEVTVSAYAGESRMGFNNIYNAALRDINNGAYAEAQRKFNVIADAAGVEIENAFGEMATTMSADITASVIAGDAKPAVTATIGVTADRLGMVIGRAAMIGKRLGQPNTFITEKANYTKFGLEKDGAMVVPSLTITLDEPLDSVGLRTLVDSAPAIFQGATQSADKRTLTVFMVPDTNIGTAEAREWTMQAQTLLNSFVQTYTTPAESYANDALQRLSMEVAPGEGSPAHALVGDAFYDLPTERQHQVNRDLTESAIREVESIMGVRLKSIVFGLGGWQHYQNASTVLQANLTPKQAEIAAHMLGYTLQQTAVWSNKITPFSNTSNAYAVDFIENGSKHLANSDKLSEVWAKLVEADDTSSNLDDKLFQGFQPIRAADGRTGIRVIIKSFSEGTGNQVERLLNGPIKDVVKSLDMELEVEGYSCVLIEAENDWKEKRNGESYLERLGDLLGPSAKSTIPKLDTARQKLEQQLKSAIETKPRKRQAIASGRRRLWNLGSSELGGKGRFIEYETVRDIVSNVAPDDSLPSPEKVANTVNQAQRREIEEALSAIAGKRINLPKRVRFKRTPEHSIFQMHVGRHYENMPKNALRSDPHVKMAYDALVKELDQQFRSLNLSVDFMQPVLDKNGKQMFDASGDPMYIDPYTNADGKLDSSLAIRDVRENRHLYVYPTTEGTVGDAGDKADFEYLAKNHPLFQQSGFKTRTGQPMMWNDVLRAVHDALAHGTYGSSFSENGEEAAFVAHAILTQDPWAIWALATETRMQNSWVHYGPHRVLADGTFVTTKPEGFASQKVGLSALECLYTGCSTVDDRLRVFSRKLRTEFNGYNGTIAYLSNRQGATVPNMGASTGAVEAQMKRKLYIMRGLPGSGKSTKAKELAGKLGKIFSTDDYFMQDGEYRFDAARLPENHRRNLDDSTMAMRRGTGTVVIDNTNIEPWHFEKYVEAGRLYGYEIEFVEFDPRNYSDAKIRELASRNTHRVPESAIRAMKDKWVAIDAKKYKDAKVMGMTGTDLPTASSFGPMLLHNPDATDAVIDLKNGTVEGNITPQAIDEAGHQSTFIPNPDGTQADINKGIFEEPDNPNLMPQVGRISEAARRGVGAAIEAMRPAPVVQPSTSVRTQPIKNPAARAVFVLNQLLKAGAAGDASPVLMQNFPLALDKPDLFLRQLRLQAQVVFNPNLGWSSRNGKTTAKNLMFGRKLAQDVWDTEVRSRASYELAKKAGLSVSAISNEKDLEDAKLMDPSITLMDISELGHNSDVATEADFLQHLPGQGQSERFFMLSKDVVKMRQFDDMVQHLIDIGYNPTDWVLDDNGKLIKTHWTRAVTDIAHILNVISGDVRIIEESETDEAVMRVAKLLLFSPRWTASRLMVDRMGRGIMSFAAKGVPGGKEKVEQILRMNGMSEEQIDRRDPRVGALHARLLWKSWTMWLGILAGIYAMRATNPRTMAVSIDKGGTRFKVGDYSFRMPGALMTQIEILSSVIDGWGEWEAQKGTVMDKPLTSIVWDKVGQTLLSRASPVVSGGVELITQRDTLGQPAFVTDEAVKVFHEEVIEPMGVKGIPSEWNKALTKRVMWWWVRDCMEMYQQQRQFGVESSEALLNAAAVGAYSAQGGRVNYFPKALTNQIKAGQKMETQYDSPTDFFTGGKAVIPDVDLYDAEKGPQPQDIKEPIFGGLGSDYMNPDILRRTEPSRQ